MAKSFGIAMLALLPMLLLSGTLGAVGPVVVGLVLSIAVLKLVRALPSMAFGWTLPGLPAVVILHRRGAWAVVFGEAGHMARLVGAPLLEGRP